MKDYKNLLNQHLPVLSVRTSVVYPGLSVPLRIGRLKSINAVKEAERNGGWMVAVSQKTDQSAKEPEASDLALVGTLGKIESVKGSPETGYQILFRGVIRFRVSEFIETDEIIRAAGVEWADALDADARTSLALLNGVKDLAREILDHLPGQTKPFSEMLAGIDDLGYLVSLCASNLDISVETKQDLLETPSLRDRAVKLLEIMRGSLENLKIQSDIRTKLSNRLGKTQREAILREQLKTIQEELGDASDPEAKENFRKRIEEAGMPPETKKVALDELKRLESMGPQNPESHMIRNYLEWLCSLPWSSSAPETIDLDQAKQILEADHYGLDKIKKRILQHLAVMKLKKGGKGSILLLVGPPGVGKTSLGQSIAKALGRKFVRASLGGVRDESEIRGHRRTYIGSLPGRILQSLKRAKENNPVFLLDEIDKLARGFQGDPASALLEVLDPEQNSTFVDHYLDVPFDLSKVFFIATANSLDTIPSPLMDRLEVIDLNGYTTSEKLHIARNHLLSKQLTEHGMEPGQIVLPDDVLMKIINHYTREAGVRELQRMIGTICRASAEKVLNLTSAPGTISPVILSTNELEEILGPEKFAHEVIEKISPPGVVTGLAWTPHGGEILFIESTLMPGTGKLILTGQLGDVMKESAQIASSLVRSKLAVTVPGMNFEKHDLHVHVPSGAIPKDGPSAGIALLTSLASLMTGRSVNSKLAMTGEITLRGAVMPVGGIKEKVLAAHRAGIERVILSRKNEKDLRDVPTEVRLQLRFDFVDSVTEVLGIALGGDWATSTAPQLPMSPTAAQKDLNQIT